MATGIVSVALHLTGYELLSRVILAVGCFAWLTLAADFVLRLLGDRPRWIREAGTPGALTAVAATTVLGTRFSALGGRPSRRRCSRWPSYCGRDCWCWWSATTVGRCPGRCS